MGNFSKNPDKLSYAYLLATTGVAEKAALTLRFLQLKMAEYENLWGKIEATIDALKLQVGQPPKHSTLDSSLGQ
jgi:hypothetical protein